MSIRALAMTSLAFALFAHSARATQVTLAPAPSLADLACSVESCAAGGTGIPGCTCVVSLP